MWYKVFILTSICVFSSCANKMLIAEHNNVRLAINTTKDVVYDTISVSVSFENNSTDAIYLLKRDFFYISGSGVSLWSLEVLFQDTLQMGAFPFV